MPSQPPSQPAATPRRSSHITAAIRAIEDLHRAHNDPVPRDAMRRAMAGGAPRDAALTRAAVVTAHARLAAEARLGAARRRAALAAALAFGDPWLSRLSATLAHHRHAACRPEL